MDTDRLTQVVTRAWEEALGPDGGGGVCAGADFFALGGDSLTAQAVAHTVTGATGREVTGRWLYEHPRLADAVRALATTAVASAARPVAGPRFGAHPLSFQQEGLSSVMDHIAGGHRYQLATALRLGSGVDPGRLREAAARLPGRHPVLATRITPTTAGLVQDVAERHVLELEPLTVRGPIAGAIGDWAAAPVNLPGPLVRGALAEAGGGRYLLLAAHQMVADPWTWGLLLHDLALLCNDPDAGEAPELAYSDYARWQRTHLSGPVFAEHLGFWREQADGVPATGLRLPGAPRSAAPAGPADRIPVTIAGPLAGAVRERAAGQGASLFEALLGLFQLATGRWTGYEDVLVASATASRAPGTERIAGFFVNGRFTRTRLTPMTLAGLVDTVRDEWRRGAEHAELHLEKTLFDLGVPDLANVKFSLNTLPGRLGGPSLLGGEPLHPVPVRPGGAGSARRHVSVNLTADSGGRGLAGTVTYRTDVLSPGAMAELVDGFTALLAAYAADPGAAAGLRAGAGVAG
ncbi:condensation domain-containing protein [Streptomyces tsukubensis]|uniref:condensation domain-containing protein n=1 Tax=Streptomyces tsukubensis TaxID=83656 RepID=UPI00344F5A11